jgi:anaerobic selenocysteine-containing dehydrogenase
MIGTAEDHHSNPMKVELAKLKRNGGRFISINPVRTGYSAIADEWVPIKPGTDGALFLAIIHELIKLGLYDRDFLVRYTNSAELVNMDEASSEHGMFVRFEVPEEEGCFDPQNKLWWDRDLDKPISTHTEGVDPFLMGEFELSDGTKVKPAFQLLKPRSPRTRLALRCNVAYLLVIERSDRLTDHNAIDSCIRRSALSGTHRAIISDVGWHSGRFNPFDRTRCNHCHFCAVRLHRHDLRVH